VIKLVSDLCEVGSFLRLQNFHPANKTDCHNISVLLKVTLINPPLNDIYYFYKIFQENKLHKSSVFL